MIRCKRCGKTLPNDAKFCSNCGVSFSTKKTVTKSKSNQASTGSKRSSYDRYRKQKMRLEMKRRKRKRNLKLLLFWVIFLAIAAAVIGGFYANSMYNGRRNNSDEQVVDSESSVYDETIVDSDDNASGEDYIEKTEESEIVSTPEPKKTNLTIDEKAQESGCLIYEDPSYEFKCAYPERFVEGTLKNNNTRASFADESGGADLLINFEKIGKSETAKSLIDAYIDKIGVEPDVDNVGDNFYSLTFTRGGRIYHRKALILKDKYIYYDFMYDQGSDSKNVYEEYIDFMDMYLEQVNK